ncbi:glycosyltransferase [Aerococcaceae bacterium DSM 111022]|nr:glycosyltransferase [Aerococcaceae bacterium DSM 111022]
MINILFIKSEKAYLPEIDAYLEYFNNTDDFYAEAKSINNLSNYKDKFDILWEFKGFRGVKPNKKQVLVHEYASLSTGKHYKSKNFIKEKFDYKPDLRVFLNNNLKEQLNFKHEAPFNYRDMGVDEVFFNQRDREKKFDFVYLGSMNKGREITKLLDNFRNADYTICLIGEPDAELYQEYKKYSNIHFVGKVDYKEVPKIASQASYGINYIPNEYPYNIQTSTKLLEYLALNLKVVTTDYKWVRGFEKKYNNSFFYLSNNKIDFEKLENSELNSYLPKENFLWLNIIENSGIKENLYKLLSQKKGILL